MTVAYVEIPIIAKFSLNLGVTRSYPMQETVTVWHFLFISDY